MDENRNSIESRLAKVEAQVAALMAHAGREQSNWIATIGGTRKDDIVLDEILRLGKEARDAERPNGDEPSVSRGPTSLFSEIAELFASSLSQQTILDFRPSQATVERASHLLELNRAGELDEAGRRELDQFEMAESLMRLVKAWLRAGGT